MYDDSEQEGVIFFLKSRVYVLQYIPLAHQRQAAFVTVALAGMPPVEGSVLTGGLDIGLIRQSTGEADVQELILSGTERSLIAAVNGWPDMLAPWKHEAREAIQRAKQRRPDKPLTVGRWTLPWHRRTIVMGILNVTPDSFSDGGAYEAVDAAVTRARELVAAGADIIDVGGESTRPAGVYGEGAHEVSAEEEKERVLPVISRLASEVDAPISVDTYKADVAEAAIVSGAHIVNDVWGLKRDPRMAAVAARYDAPVIMMHNRERIDYDGPLMREIIDDLRQSIALARAAGVREERMILDPGIGFAKTYDHSLEVMHHLEQIVYMGYPVLLGTSRKSLIGNTLDLPVDQRVEGTAATVSYGIQKGCHIIRVHDVQEMVRVCRMTDALVDPETEGRVTYG